MPAIELDGLTKRYATRNGTVEAIRNVSFDVDAHEFVSLVGPSGCGKSTILHIAAGLIPHDSGTIRVDGSSARPGRREVGIMLQRPVLFPWRTVLDNVVLPAEIFGLDRARRRERAMELLRLVGLEGFEDKHPWELSGGMQQRASLARLLIFEPSTLLMDEPFAALDEFTRERLTTELARLHASLKKSVLYVTHNLQEAVLLSDRVVVMSARPGEVLGALRIDLVRPRAADVAEDERAMRMVAQIRRMLREHGELEG